MKSYLKSGILLVLISFLLSSCQNDELSADNYIEFDVTAYDILKIKEIDYDPSGLRLIGLKDRSDTSEKYYIIDDQDVMISYDLVNEMVESKRIAKRKKSRSNKYFAYSSDVNKEMNLNPNRVAGSISSEEELIINELANLD